jgi:hypothetical protein
MHHAGGEEVRGLSRGAVDTGGIGRRCDRRSGRGGAAVFCGSPVNTLRHLLRGFNGLQTSDVEAC